MQDENRHRSNSTLLVRNLFHFSGSVWQLKEESYSRVMVKFIAASTAHPSHRDWPRIFRRILPFIASACKFLQAAIIYAEQ